MSLIGKKPIDLPSGVSVEIAKNTVKVKGPKGELSQRFEQRFVEIAQEGSTVVVKRKGETKACRARHGLYRSLVANMVAGCTKGFTRELEINGVGYTAKAASPTKLTLSIGFCHPVDIPMPSGVKVETPANTKIILSGPDKQVVGQIAANIRAIRPPEPYKGKGIKYIEETIRRKAGKALAGK